MPVPSSSLAFKPRQGLPPAGVFSCALANAVQYGQEDRGMAKRKPPDSLTALERLAQDPDSARKPAKPSKYGIKRTEYAGRMYDSPAEARRAEELENDKEVAWWIPQVVIELGVPEHKYRVDFLVAVWTSHAAVIVHAEDVKGPETPEFRKHKKMWEKYGPFPLHVLHASGDEKRGYKIEVEIITP